jgi:hypothetical protein
VGAILAQRASILARAIGFSKGRRVAGVSDSEPAGGISRLVHKVRHGGLSWIGRRVAVEARMPTTAPGRLIHVLAQRAITTAAAAPRRLRRMLADRSFATADTLFAFYDLAVAPITFDFLWFLAGADLRRRELGLERVHVVIVPGWHGGVRQEREDYEDVVNPDARRERIHNILIPSCAFLPTSAGVTYAASRGHAHHLRSLVGRNIFPAGYEPALPSVPGPQACLAAGRRGDRSIACLRATNERLRDVDEWIAVHAGGRSIVTLTIRAYGYMSARNSNLAAWASFAEWLDQQRFACVVIPDLTQTLGGPPGGFGSAIVFPEAAWNIGLRMALYERALLNMGVNTGPMGLCWLNSRTRYGTFKMAPAGVPQTDLDYYRELEFDIGRSLSFATPVQKMVWQDDTFEVIRTTFLELLARIEGAEVLPAAMPEQIALSPRDVA